MGNFINFSFLLIIFVHTIARIDSSTDCLPVEGSSCQCRTESGFLVDLNRLFNWIPKQVPMFRATVNATEYTYQPCKSYTQGAGCINVAACQIISTTPPVEYAIGYPAAQGQSANFTGSIKDNTLNITYTGINFRETVVMLRCSKEKFIFTALGETAKKSKKYVMKLETRLVCPVENRQGLSIGSIMCIVFFVLVFIYLVGGFALMYFVKGARGTEAIPNYEFWTDVPGLIKEGFMFVARGCKAETDKTYQQI